MNQIIQTVFNKCILFLNDKSLFSIFKIVDEGCNLFCNDCFLRRKYLYKYQTK